MPAGHLERFFTNNTITENQVYLARTNVLDLIEGLFKCYAFFGQFDTHHLFIMLITLSRLCTFVKLIRADPCTVDIFTELHDYLTPNSEKLFQDI